MIFNSEKKGYKCARTFTENIWHIFSIKVRAHLSSYNHFFQNWKLLIQSEVMGFFRFSSNNTNHRGLWKIYHRVERNVIWYLRCRHSPGAHIRNKCALILETDPPPGFSMKSFINWSDSCPIKRGVGPANRLGLESNPSALMTASTPVVLRQFRASS